MIANARVNLVDKDTGPLVDLERKEWQLVELALSEIGVISPIELSHLTGNLSGTFYLDDIRLVAAPPSAMPTAVLEEHTDVQPTAFTLSQNYPNPFNPETTIRFDLPQPQDIELAIYNLAAPRVATLAQGYREAGMGWCDRCRTGTGVGCVFLPAHGRGADRDAEVVTSQVDLVPSRTSMTH